MYIKAGKTIKIFTINKKSISTSKDQLRKDFVVFPPKPLSCDDAPEFELTINQAGRFEYFSYKFMRNIRLSRLLFSSIENTSGSENIDSVRREFIKTLSGVKDSFNNIFSEFRSLGFFIKIFVGSIFVLFSPVVLFLCAIKILPVFFRNVLVASASGYTDALGEFNPILNDTFEIIVKKFALEEKAVDVDAIVTHEHLHALQYYCHSKKANRYITVEEKDVREESYVLKDSSVGDGFIKYLLQRLELEARLHEVVLSAYRKFGSLPDELIEFVDMIIRSSSFQLGYNDAYYCYDSDRCFNDGPVYMVRDSTVGLDLGQLFDSLKNDEVRVKFIREVLAPMYANLLEYYGDSDASMRFRSQIEGPNLYDRLYFG